MPLPSKGEPFFIPYKADTTSTTTNAQSSVDFGMSWQSAGTLPGTGALQAAWHDGTTWVAVGLGGIIYTCTDLVPISTSTWTSRTSGTANALVSVTKSGSLWVAVGQSNTIVTSPDATTWTVRTSAAPGLSTYPMVFWLGSASTPVFAIVCGASGTASSAVQTSPDGITWTTRTVTGLYVSAVGSGFPIATPGTAAALVPFASGTLLVAYGATSAATGLAATNAIFTSPDGVTWTQRTMGFAATTSAVGAFIIWNGAVALAAGTSNGASTFAFTSVDGITWTQRAPMPMPFPVTSVPAAGLTVGSGKRTLPVPTS